MYAATKDIKGLKKEISEKIKLFSIVFTCQRKLIRIYFSYKCSATNCSRRLPKKTHRRCKKPLNNEYIRNFASASIKNTSN